MQMPTMMGDKKRPRERDNAPNETETKKKRLQMKINQAERYMYMYLVGPFSILMAPKNLSLSVRCEMEQLNGCQPTFMVIF